MSPRTTTPSSLKASNWPTRIAAIEKGIGHQRRGPSFPSQSNTHTHQHAVSGRQADRNSTAATEKVLSTQVDYDSSDSSLRSWRGDNAESSRLMSVIRCPVHYTFAGGARRCCKVTFSLSVARPPQGSVFAPPLFIHRPERNRVTSRARLRVAGGSRVRLIRSRLVSISRSGAR